MPLPRILVIPGSLRARSYNARLAALATKELIRADAEVTRISLQDYPLPIYDGDAAEKSGPPRNAVRLKQLLAAHQGVLIASPEYNASFTPLIKNAIDWVSVVRERGEPPLAVFQDRAFALAAASPRGSGAVLALLALRQVLAVGCRALVLAEQVSIAHADEAFDEMDELRDAGAAEQLRHLARRLVETARLLAVDPSATGHLWRAGGGRRVAVPTAAPDY
jgi:NAD(P)H-dependent FMN reductase